MRRVEDGRLITGRGRFAADVHLPAALHMAVRRSTAVHANVTRIDASRAAGQAGVVGAFTAADLPPAARFLAEDGLPPHLAAMRRPVLAGGEVRYAGEPIGIVVAADEYVAHDAAAAIEVDLEPLAASEEVVWRGADGFGDVDAAFAGAPVVVHDRLVMERVCGAAIEPRAAVAAPSADGVEVWTSTQAVYRVRDTISRALTLERDKVVVRAHDVGGGFGPKGRAYPEEVLVAWAAKKLDRPIAWTASRGEDLATSMQAHGSVFEMEIAAGDDGIVRAVRCTLSHDLGAYPSIGALVPASIMRTMLCAYRVPAFRLELRGVLTNAVPTGTVRGGGAPQGDFAMERMMDRLAARLGLEPAEIRRRNLLTRDEMPYRVPMTGTTLMVDGGDRPRMLDDAMRLVGSYSSPDDGRLHGVGVAIGVEHTASVVESEPARVRLAPDGSAEVTVGSTPHGQGHETMVAQVVADRLSWPVERITVRLADTSLLDDGGPTAASRGAVNVGNAAAAVATAARQALDVAGGKVPAGGLDITDGWQALGTATSPASCHAVAVAVDPETGAVELLRYVVVYDSGTVINPAMVEGQLHGGMAHGIGYALLEDAGMGRDYMVCGVGDVVLDPVLISCPTPANSNAEGIKGAGEVGTVAAPAAIASAVEAALRQKNPAIEIRELPIRPERTRA